MPDDKIFFGMVTRPKSISALGYEYGLTPDQVFEIRRSAGYTQLVGLVLGLVCGIGIAISYLWLLSPTACLL